MGNKIEYIHPAFESDVIEVFTWVSSMKRITSLRKYKLVRSKDGLVLANAETDWVFYNVSTNRPTRVAENVRNAFPVIPESDEP